jgi:chemotaxis protein methyltransferase CheR
LALLAATVASELAVVPDVEILATDVSSVAVAATTAATYAGRSVGLLDDEQRERWFEPAPFADGEVDLIVCRNVTIYFSRDTMRALIGRFHRALAPGGYLVLGHAETLWKVTDDFTLVKLGDAFAYRKELPAPGTPEPAGDVSPPPARTPRRAAKPQRALPPATAALVARVVGRAAEPDSVPDPDAATSLLAQANEALEQAHYAQAARLAAQAAAASPFEVDAYVVEGRARATVGDDRGAVVALRKAVYLAPRAGHARFMLAGALARCSEPAAAAREYRAAAATLPTTSAADLAGLLDGCGSAELGALCRRHAAECDRRAGQPTPDGWSGGDDG